MAQNLADILGDPAIRAALAYNQTFGLSDVAVRIIQCRVSDSISGKMDMAMMKGLLQQDYSEVFLRTLVEARRKAANLSPIPDTWEACLKFLSSPDDTSVASAVRGELGKVTDEVIWALANDMALSGDHNLALIMVADYLRLPREDKALFLRFDPTLAYTYQSQVAFSDIMVTPLQDINRREDGKFIVSSAPQNRLNIYIGPSAFQDWKTLKQALLHAFLVEVAMLKPEEDSDHVGPEKQAEAFKKLSVRFSSSVSGKLIQGLGGQHISEELNEGIVEAVARFQAKRGLSIDGDLGPKTLNEMRKALRESHLFEGEIVLVMGYYGMWEKDILGLFYDPVSEDLGLEVDQNIAPLKTLKIGKEARNLDTSSIVDQLMPVCSPLMVYQGRNFGGNYRPKIDKDFLTAIQRVDDLAGQNGLKIIVTGANAASFRPEGTIVGGAIVTPAGRSNHKVGHAIDMNLEIVENGEYYNSARMRKTNSTNWDSRITAFFKGIRDDMELRWGGDFVREPDPVHIDDGLNLLTDSLRYEQRYQATQTAAGYEQRSRSLERSVEESCNY